MTVVRVPRAARITVVVVAAALVAALLGGRPGRDGPPLDPRSDGPLGTSALVSLLQATATDVELSVGLPDEEDSTALVLRDTLDPDQSGRVRRWVEAGGTLVVVDPGSSLVPLATTGAADSDVTVEPGACSIPALRRIGEVEVGTAARYDVAAVERACFGDEQRAFLVSGRVGAGQVVATGGAAFLTNERLGRADNAVLAVALLGPRPGTTVRFVDAPVPAGGGEETLVDLVPGGVRRALLQLAFAFLLYAVWRSLRLGRPVLEGQPVEVAGSALVAAIGRLLERTRSPALAGERLRAELRRELRVRLAVPSDAGHDTLSQVTAARTGVPVHEVERAIDERPIGSDAELVAVARAVSTIQKEIRR